MNAIRWVLGAGPGGYTAAFRAADLGQKVVVVERYPVLGGVCLECRMLIPSKALLHAAKVIAEAEEMNEAGVSFSKPEIDPGKLNQWKQGVVDKLTGRTGRACQSAEDPGSAGKGPDLPARMKWK